MKAILYKNLANAVVLARVVLIFAVMTLLTAPSLVARICGLVLLAVAALLDWFDGYVAGKLGISSTVGGLLDTLGDRITENILFIFFAYQHIVPFYVPVCFVTRSFMADFIRTLSFSKGLSTFEINTSPFGAFFVSSRPSRVLYLVMKLAIFFAAGLILVIWPLNIMGRPSPVSTVNLLHDWVNLLSALTVTFSSLRFIGLLYDSRVMLKEEFLK